MIKIYFIIVLIFIGLEINAQGIQKTDADAFPRDKNDNSYGFSNETAYLFNPSKDKNVQFLGKNYYDTPSLIKKDENAEIVWKKVIIPSGGIWVYQLLLAKDNFIYVGATLKGNLRLPLKGRKYANLKANANTDEGNPFLLKLNKEGEVLWAVLLANDRDSYRIFDAPPMSFNRKTKQLTVKTELRKNGGKDIPYMIKTYIVDAETGKVLETTDQ